MTSFNLDLECLDNKVCKLCPGQFIDSLGFIRAHKPLPDILRPGLHDRLGLRIVLADRIVKPGQDACCPLPGLRRVSGTDTKLIREPAGHTRRPGLNHALGSCLLIGNALIESGHGIRTDAGQHG